MTPDYFGPNMRILLLKRKRGNDKKKQEIEESKHMHALLFPQRIKREKLNKYRFLEVLKQLYVKISFTEVLTQISAYAKFLKQSKTEETITIEHYIFYFIYCT